MNEREINRAVRAMAKISVMAVRKEGGLQEVTVLSKNPDGTVNVDDGTGGCIRVLGFTNARIGTKIRLTQPPLGTQTNDPPRFLHLPKFPNPPEFPPFTPENPDRYMVSDHVASWGAIHADTWGTREEVRTWVKTSGSPSFYGQGYIIPFPNAVDNSAQAVESNAGWASFPVVDVVGASSLPWSYGRTLFQFPRLDTIVADDEQIESASVEITLAATHSFNPAFSRISVFAWTGLGRNPDGTLAPPLSISTDDIPYYSTSLINATNYLNGQIDLVVVGDAPITSNSTGLWNANNTIPLNVYGLAALERRRPTVLAFIVDFFRQPNTSPAQHWAWTPWVPVLPGRHAPKPKKGARILASGPGTASTPETRARLRLKIKQA